MTLLVCLCACGGNKPAEDNDTTATTTTTSQATNGFDCEDDNLFNDAELSW